MRRLHPLLVSLLALNFACNCSGPPQPEKAKNLDKIEPKEKDAAEGTKTESGLGELPTGPIAKVGEVEIPNATFREIYDLKVKKYTDRGREVPESADRRYRKSIAERLIYHEILNQEAKSLGVSYDEAELQERIDQQKQGSRDWDKQLSRRGETDTSLRAMYEAELLEKAILDKLGKLALTDPEIQEDYEKIKKNWKSDKPRIRASHILVPIGPGGDRPPTAPAGGTGGEPQASDEEKAKWDEEAKQKAEDLYKQVTVPGADFAAIATEQSTGPSAKKGGDLGIFTADRMAEEFSAAAFAMDVGEISKPIKTKFGYHVIKVVGKWPPGELPMDALRDQIERRLSQRKLHRGRKDLKTELLAKYTVVDHIAAALGPEPERKRPPRRQLSQQPGEPPLNPHGGRPNPHGGGKPARAVAGDNPAGEDEPIAEGPEEVPAANGDETPPDGLDD